MRHLWAQVYAKCHRRGTDTLWPRAAGRVGKAGGERLGVKPGSAACRRRAVHMPRRMGTAVIILS